MDEISEALDDAFDDDEDVKSIAEWESSREALVSELEEDEEFHNANPKMPQTKRVKDLNRSERRKYLSRSEQLRIDLDEGNRQITKEAKRRKQKRKAQKAARRKNRK